MAKLISYLCGDSQSAVCLPREDDAIERPPEGSDRLEKEAWVNADCTTFSSIKHMCYWCIDVANKWWWKVCLETVQCVYKTLLANQVTYANSRYLIVNLSLKHSVTSDFGSLISFTLLKSSFKIKIFTRYKHSSVPSPYVIHFNYIRTFNALRIDGYKHLHVSSLPVVQMQVTRYALATIWRRLWLKTQVNTLHYIPYLSILKPGSNTRKSSNICWVVQQNERNKFLSPFKCRMPKLLNLVNLKMMPNVKEN